MRSRICVIDLPGLSRQLVSHVPGDSAIGRWMREQTVRGLTPSFPALTCSAQATLTTSQPPASHGIIANGLATYRSAPDQALVDASNFADYRRDVSFWEQSNQFLETPRFWQNASGESKYKTALLFFQHCMPGFAGSLKPAADIVITPKPEHGPDGKITSLLWAQPAEMIGKLFAEFGPFPLMNYWGPMAGLASSQWIANAAAWVWRNESPDLQWVYVPHLDYDLQRFGPDSPQAQKAMADVAGALDPLVNAVLGSGARLVLLSEYAMRDVKRCAFPNRALAKAGLLKTRATPDGALVDYAHSDAFALVDHQIAHVYVRDRAELPKVQSTLKEVDGIASVRPREALPELNHRRTGDLVVQSALDTWLAYPWWTEAADAPKFARMVDIHRKPGYDPLELFWDRAANGTGINPALVKGSHGLVEAGEAILIGELPGLTADTVKLTEVGAQINAAMQE